MREGVQKGLATTPDRDTFCGASIRFQFFIDPITVIFAGQTGIYAPGYEVKVWKLM
jgi:hypothetical protein